MKLVHKDGVQVMEIDDSAAAWEIAMFKKQGWSEPGYQCSRCGWVPLSKGLCDCIGKKEDSKMKYSIGDRVIVKESGEKGIVVNVLPGKWHFVIYLIFTSNLGSLEMNRNHILMGYT